MNQFAVSARGAIPKDPARISTNEILAELENILESPIFRADRDAPTRAGAILRFMVDHAIAGSTEELTQVNIAAEVFKRYGYDPTFDAQVRVEVRRLRDKLREYYGGIGSEDTVIISVPLRSYVPQFKRKRTVDSKHPNLRAFESFQRGRLLWEQRTPASLSEAKVSFEDALVHYPEYAAAHAALAECYAFMAIWGIRPAEVIPRLRYHAEAALEIDEQEAVAHAALGFAASAFDYDWEQGEEHFRLALKLDHYCMGAYLWFSSCLLALGRRDEAILQCHRAQKLETSISVVVNSHVAKILHVSGKFKDAEVLLRRLLEQAPQFYLSHWHMGLVYFQTDRLDSAIFEIESAINLAGRNASIVASLGCAYAANGRKYEAEKILDELVNRTVAGEYVPATDISILYGHLGQLDGAFEWLDAAYEQRDLFLTWLAVWPLFHPLRKDPRYTLMLRRIGLMPTARRPHANVRSKEAGYSVSTTMNN